MNETLISAENVSKKFCRNLKKSLWYGVQDSLTDLSRRRVQHDALRSEEFWANKDISFGIKRGECVGLIGQNGAGKTTVLKMLNGLIKPDVGQISMTGRISAMIALGAGFNPILTGRENIYVNGSIIGLSRRQIADMLDDIVDFASLEDFIDSPVRTYSSGMQVRLGFSVASSLNPDVLLVDEVLAVGDAAFRSKCFGRLANLLDNAAVILVSHQMNAIANMCSRVILMHQGRVVRDGTPSECIHEYDCLNESEAVGGFVRLTPPITGLSFALAKSEIRTGESIDVEASVDCIENVEIAVVRLVFYNESGTHVAELGSEFLKQTVSLVKGTNQIAMCTSSIRLKAGRYRLSLCISTHRGLAIVGWDHLNTVLTVIGNHAGFANYQLEGSITSEH